ncbi:endonuclease 8-like 3 isoform X2 [Oratosquilla oratoria]|uniref:endonuclease 8-like 3 isoform X2 n=1 Tax=Oratosquilla oratoria TaxID=337810 RepID=UPI003F772776
MRIVSLTGIYSIMVEGPGCKLKGETLKKRALSQHVKSVSGNAVKDGTKSNLYSSGYEILVGRKLDDVKTLGKELFAFFGDVCLRVHFLMSGFVRFNNEARQFGDGKSESPRLLLKMNRDMVGFYNSSVELRSSQDCLEKYTSLISLDICSPEFDAQRATQAMQEHELRFVADVLLDQLVLPGVGNIIKNECRRTGLNLKQFMNIYQKSKCPECGGRVTRCKMGEYERATFFCPGCQTNTKSTNKKKFPSKNSVLSWLESGRDQAPWACSTCTLENKPASTKCSVCLTPRGLSGGLEGRAEDFQWLGGLANNREASHHETAEEIITSNPSDPGDNQHNKPVCARQELYVSADSSGSKYRFKRLRNSASDTSEQLTPKNLAANTSKVMTLRSQTVDTLKLLPANPESGKGSMEQVNQKVVVCRGHKQKAKRAQVVKNNENKGRIFFTCAMPRGAQCDFFEWGDLDHPKCEHGNITVLRTVYKQNSNNGRLFYSCPLAKSKKCEFFKWADDKKIEHGE